MCLARRIWNLTQLASQFLVEGRLLRRKERIERIARRLCNCALHRRVGTRCPKPGIALAAPVNCVHGFENRDVYDRHGSARARWTELFSKDAILARRHGCVVKSAGVDRDLIPVPNSVGGTDPMRDWVR